MHFLNLTRISPFDKLRMTSSLFIFGEGKFSLEAGGQDDALFLLP